MNNIKEIKLKISTIISFIFMIMVISNCKGFYLLLPIEQQNIFVYFYYGCTLLSILFIFIFKKKDKIMYKKLNMYIILSILLFFIPQFIYTNHQYHLGIKSYISAINQYSFIVWSIPILYLIYKEEGYDKLISRISNIVTFGYILIIIGVFLQNRFGMSFFNVERWIYKNDTIRLLNLSAFMPIVLVYNWNKIIHKTATKKHYFILLVTLIATIFVEQTRFQMLTVAVTMFLMYLFKRRATINRYFLYFLTISLITFTLSSGFLTNYISKFSIENNGVSTSYRIKELEYYLGKFNDNKLFGIGTIPLNDIYRIYRISSYGDMNPNDIGIFGALGLIGSGVIILFIIPMIRWTCICFKTMRSESTEKDGIVLLGLLSYLIFSSMTLFILNFQRAPLFPFCIAIFEYYNYKLIKNKTYIGDE